MNVIKTRNNLDFMCRKWHVNPEFIDFKVGTCHGLYGVNSKEYFIIAIVNDEKGNGHFEDVIEWFEYSCKRDKKNLAFCEVWNKNLEKHLIDKRGYIKGDNKVYKIIS